MLKIPTDKYGNQGWAVRARIAHRCESRRSDFCRNIEPGSWYYRTVAWPGSDANGGDTPWILKICRDCLNEDLMADFDNYTAGFLP